MKVRDRSEPRAEGGGETLYEVGATEGGAPFGMTEEEFRRSNESDNGRAGWALAKRVLRQTAEAMGVREPESAVGYVRWLGEGFTYRAYAAECRVRDVRGERDAVLVARLPKPDTPSGQAERATREFHLVGHLSALALEVRVPRILAVVPVPEGRALVQEAADGLPVELRAPANHRARPWNLVARAAAACAEVAAEPLKELLPHFPTRRHHALAVIETLAKVDVPEARAAQAWTMSHLPPERPSGLVHGDLLGQNLRLGVEDDTLEVLDWENALIGDPAYDLAIVTRGKRQPFQTGRGLKRLLEAYNSRTSAGIAFQDVRLYELCLQAGFYVQDARRFGPESPAAENARRTLANLLQRASSVSDLEPILPSEVLSSERAGQPESCASTTPLMSSQRRGHGIC